MFTTIRANISRKVALVAIFAMLLVGSGLSSLATIYDNVTNITTASAASIDAKINGTKSLATDLSIVEPGSVHYRAFTLTNSGTAYSNWPAAVTGVSEGALTSDTLRQVHSIANATQCNPTDLPAGSWTDPNVSTPLSTPMWPRATVTGTSGGEFQILPGDAVYLCAIYKVGNTGVTYAFGGDSHLQVNDAFNVYFP